MAITVYSDIVLSQSQVQAGVRGKQIRRNSRVTTDSGAESINIIWTQTLRQFEIGLVPMSRAIWQTIETLHEITEGGAYGFLLEDPKDSVVSTGQGVVQGLTSTTFQLYKRNLHSASGRYKDRKITRPRSSGFSVSVSGTPLSGGSYSLNVDTGVITIASAPSASTVTWTGNFYVPVHFMDDSIDWETVGGGQTADARFVAGPNVMLQEIRE